MPNIKKDKLRLVEKQNVSVSDQMHAANFKVSFQYFDHTQKFGSGFKDWQRIGQLSKALETLQGYCCSPLQKQIDGDKFAIYGSFPPSDKT